MTWDEVNGFLVKECGLSFDEVYRLCTYEKMLVLGYRPTPRATKDGTNPFFSPHTLAKPEHMKKPMPGFVKRGKANGN